MTNYIKAYRDPSNVYHAEAKRVAGEFTSDAAVMPSGVVRWNSNGRVPPIEILDLWADLGFEFAYWESINTQEHETQAFLAEYRANYKGPTDEEWFAALAAFGPGEKIVNVVTGTSYIT